MLAKKVKIVPIDSSLKVEPKPNSVSEQVETTVERKLTFKVSPKKAVSVYGLQRFPVTLYKDQWLTLIDNIEVLKEFIKNHENELAQKEQQEE